MTTDWNTHQAKQLTKTFRTHAHHHNLPCWLCGQPIDYTAPHGTKYSFQTDHYWPRSKRPDLTYDWDNLRPAHTTCNTARRHKNPPQPQPPTGTHSRHW